MTLFGKKPCPSFFVQSVATLYFQKLLRSLLSKTHPQALTSGLLFAAAFSDSGHWDYAILSFFDTFFRVGVVLTLGPTTDVSIGEKGGFAANAVATAGGAAKLPILAKGFAVAPEALNSFGLLLLALLALASFSLYL